MPDSSLKLPKEPRINVLIIRKTLRDQGSSVSQQLFKLHELNPLICSLNLTKFLQVTRGSLTDEKHLPALTTLSSASLDKAFFLITFSLLTQTFPEEVSRRFPTHLRGCFDNTETLIAANLTSLDMRGGTFKAIWIREYMIEATWQKKMYEVWLVM